MADEPVGSDIARQFNEDLNEANALYDRGRLNECIEKARAILGDPAILRYHRLKTLIPLSSTLRSWHEADKCRASAEIWWIIVRRWNCVGEDKTIDIYMAEICDDLDELTILLKAKEPSDPEDMLSEEDDEEEEEDEQDVNTPYKEKVKTTPPATAALLEDKTKTAKAFERSN